MEGTLKTLCRDFLAPGLFGLPAALMTPSILQGRPPGQMTVLYPHVTPGISAGTEDVGETVADPTLPQLEVIRPCSPLFAKALAERRFGFGAGAYDLATARVRALETAGVDA